MTNKQQTEKHLILVHCMDKVGLVATISNVLAAHQQNIISMREFADNRTNEFFSRIACEGPEFNEEEIFHLMTEKLGPKAKIQIAPIQSQKKIVVLVTKEFHCLQDILVKEHFGTLGAEVCAVIGNHKELGEFTNRFSIPFHHIGRQDKSKVEFEKELLETIGKYQPEYLVLAKFMQILSPEFVDQYPQRIINIHHSFLPAFKGANPYKQAFERGVKIIGATAHFVTADLDNGPIISQETKHINHNYNSKMMRTAGKEIERNVLSTALDLVFSDRVFVTGNKTVIFD